MNEKQSKPVDGQAQDERPGNSDPITRRSAVGRMAAMSGAVGAMGILADGRECEASTPGGSLIDLELDQLVKLVGTDFSISGPLYDQSGPRVNGEIRLHRVDQNNWVLKYDQPEHPHKHACPLSVIFTCSDRITDATYRLHSRKTGVTDLFIHYIGQKTPDGSLLYEAVIY